LGSIPNPQSPIPNPQSPINEFNINQNKLNSDSFLEKDIEALNYENNIYCSNWKENSQIYSMNKNNFSKNLFFKFLLLLCFFFIFKVLIFLFLL